jgi:hypothetical protein
MPRKEIVQVNLAAANPNLSPAARLAIWGSWLVKTGRHPITGACAEKKQLPTASTAIGSINRRAFN